MKTDQQELHELRIQIYNELMELFKEKEYAIDGKEMVASYIALQMAVEAFHYMLVELGCDAASLYEVSEKAATLGREVAYSMSEDKMYISKLGKA